MITIRPAKNTDAEVLYQLIIEIAKYEKLEHQVENSVVRIEKEFFGSDPKVFALIIEKENAVIGYTIYFFNYSTFIGKHGLYLEDFYIQEPYRREGIGQQVFDYLFDICTKQDLGRMEWMVLKWNTPALNFYEKYKPEILDEWFFMRLNEGQLKNSKKD